MNDLTRPLYAQTQAVLSALDRGQAAALQPLTTEDLSLVDTDERGRPAALHTRAALAEHLERRGPALRASTVLAYEGHPDRETAWSVVRFRRSAVSADGVERRELCSATLLWRLTTEGWKLARWHCTVEREDRDHEDQDHEQSPLG